MREKSCSIIKDLFCSSVYICFFFVVQMLDFKNTHYRAFVAVRSIGTKLLSATFPDICPTIASI